MSRALGPGKSKAYIHSCDNNSKLRKGLRSRLMDGADREGKLQKVTST